MAKERGRAWRRYQAKRWQKRRLRSQPYQWLVDPAFQGCWRSQGNWTREKQIVKLKNTKLRVDKDWLWQCVKTRRIDPRLKDAKASDVRRAQREHDELG